MTKTSPSSPSNKAAEDPSAEAPPAADSLRDSLGKGESTNNDASESGAAPSRYFAQRPNRRPLSLESLKSWPGKIWYLFRHTLSSYDPNLPELLALTSDNPKGSIQKEQVELCRLVYETQEHRQEKLEEKSTAALSLVAVLTPLIVSAAVYMATSSGVAAKGRKLVLVIFTLSFFSLLVAFIAAVRATGIRSRPSLHIHSVIGHQTDVIRAFSPDYFGRALLWCASVNSAVNDHVADFARAAQVFLVFSVTLLVFAAAPVLVMLKPTAKAQEITEAVQVESAALQEMSVSSAKTAGALAQLEKDRVQVERMEGDLSALRNRIAELEKRASAKGRAGHLGSSKEGVRRRAD